MSTHEDLFENGPRQVQPSQARKWPVVWVREISIFKRLAEGPDSLVRSIRLKPGLNILWAKPDETGQTTRLHERGFSGHASGKTTFCRLLRYMLGENTFGTEFMRSRVREHFDEGRIVAEVEVHGTPWLVCRPFAVGPHSYAVRNAGMSDLFTAHFQQGSFAEYLKAIDEAVLGAFPIRTFAATDDPITWQHVIESLARDQECRFSGLADWRHPSSESESPEPSVDDRHHILRAMLSLIATAEQDELAKNAQLVKDREEAKRNLPLKAHQAQVDLRRLRESVKIDLPNMADPLFTDAVERHLRQRRESLEKEFADDLARQRISALLAESQRAGGELAVAKRDMDEVQQTFDFNHKRLQVHTGELTQKQLDDYLASQPPSKGYCNVRLDVAQKCGCFLAAREPISFDTERAVMTQEKIIAIEEQNVAALRLMVEEKRKWLTQKKAVSERAAAAHAAAQKEQEERAFALAKARAHLDNLSQLAQNAVEAGLEAESLKSRIEELDRKIDQSYATQQEIRKRQARVLGEFSEVFDAIVKAVMGDEVTGACSFVGRNLALSMKHRGILTSAAIETIKIIAFDLAAMIAGIEGRGHHPGILIHDGPREADMSAVIYRRFFLFVRDLEAAFPHGQKPTFQYIITTTEPPPEEVMRAPWLLQPVLDASDPEKRLLRVDL